MIMTYLALFLNVFLMVFSPLLLGWIIASRRRVGWRLFALGAVTFIVSQLAHIPFNWLVLQRFKWIPTNSADMSDLAILAIFLGASAGFFEEGARFLAYRYWAKDARSWGKGLMLGAGHGGIEAIILGILLGTNYVALAWIRSGGLADLIPEDLLPLVRAQIQFLFSAPWHLILLGAAERLFALCFHLAASLMVMQVFVRGHVRWLLAALTWHALLNASAVFAVSTWNAYVAEGIAGILALVSLAIVIWLRTPEPVEPEQAPLPPIEPAHDAEAEITAEMLERSRYQ